MSYSHNLLAFKVGDTLLKDVRTGSAQWVNGLLTAKTIHWPGMINWPVPDKIFEDSNGKTLAVEFKPPGQPKREYVTGLGQALTYLKTFTYAALVTPAKAGDGFQIADYLKDVLNEQYANSLPLALFCYDVSPSSLTPLVTLRKREVSPPELPASTRRAFWAYVRDASHFDVFEILRLMDVRSQKFDKAYKVFWDQKRKTGKALTLAGRPRKKKKHFFSNMNPGDRAERTNANVLMRHTELIGAEGNITETGYHLLRHGKVYTPQSESFRQMFCHQILTVGRHLDLILWIEHYQRKIRKEQKLAHKEFLHQLDKGLEQEGFIRAAPSGHAKETFLRDEPKYWNQFGLLERNKRNNMSYFHKGVGYIFDWRTIVSIVEISCKR